MRNTPPPPPQQLTSPERVCSTVPVNNGNNDIVQNWVDRQEGNERPPFERQNRWRRNENLPPGMTPRRQIDPRFNPVARRLNSDNIQHASTSPGPSGNYPGNNAGIGPNETICDPPSPFLYNDTVYGPEPAGPGNNPALNMPSPNGFGINETICDPPSLLLHDDTFYGPEPAGPGNNPAMNMPSPIGPGPNAAYHTPPPDGVNPQIFYGPNPEYAASTPNGPGPSAAYCSPPPVVNPQIFYGPEPEFPIPAYDPNASASSASSLGSNAAYYVPPPAGYYPEIFDSPVPPGPGNNAPVAHHQPVPAPPPNCAARPRNNATHSIFLMALYLFIVLLILSKYYLNLNSYFPIFLSVC